MLGAPSHFQLIAVLQQARHFWETKVSAYETPLLLFFRLSGSASLSCSLQHTLSQDTGSAHGAAAGSGQRRTSVASLGWHIKFATLPGGCVVAVRPLMNPIPLRDEMLLSADVREPTILEII